MRNYDVGHMAEGTPRALVECWFVDRFFQPCRETE